MDLDGFLGPFIRTEQHILSDLLLLYTHNSVIYFHLIFMNHEFFNFITCT